MKYKQHELKNGQEKQTVWLEDGKLKVGYKVTLKDSETPHIWWTVTKIYDVSLEKKEIHDAHDSQKWHEKDHHRRLTGLKIIS